MTRRLRRPEVQTAETGGGAGVTARHSLLTNSWAMDVEKLEQAIGGFTSGRLLATDCQVMLFEIAGDEHLHVNVIHRRAHRPAALRGWSGPGLLPDGCVYNRRFADAPAAEIVEHIRRMVFA